MQALKNCLYLMAFPFHDNCLLKIVKVHILNQVIMKRTSNFSVKMPAH